MTQFLKNNWQSFLYPFVVMLIIAFDQVLEVSYLVTSGKIFFFSLGHVIFVYKTKYIYQSDTYIYYAKLREEYESNFSYDALLAPRTKQRLFLSICFLAFLIVILRQDNFSCTYQLAILLCLLSPVYIADCFYELFRTFTNTTDFENVKTKIPGSFGNSNIHKRYMYTMIMQKVVQHGPTCINAVKGVSAGVGILEMGYPTIFADGQLGPLTKLVGNKFIYKDAGLVCPIKTAQDMVYESQRQIVEEGVIDGSRAYNHMPKRTFSFCSEMERNEFLLKNRIQK